MTVKQPQEAFSLAVNQALLFDRYGTIIFSYMRRHTASHEDAEDLTLEVFLAALESERFQQSGEREPLLWLKTVARNKLIDYYRQAQRRPSISFEVLTEWLPDEIISPEESALQQERYGEIREAVQQLNPFQQQLLQLRYGQRLSCRDIALLLNKREDAIRQQLSRTLKRLRTCYQDQSGAKGEQ